MTRKDISDLIKLEEIMNKEEININHHPSMENAYLDSATPSRSNFSPIKEEFFTKIPESENLSFQISEEENSLEKTFPDLQLKCPICFCFFNKPVMCSNCQILFCTKCLDKTLSGNISESSRHVVWNSYDSFAKKCPHCREPITKVNVQKPLFSIYNKVVIDCPNENPCTEKFKFEKLNEHLKTCGSSNYSLKCKHCSDIFKNVKKEYVEKFDSMHQEVCKGKSIECSICSRNFKRTELDTHLKTHLEITRDRYNTNLTGSNFISNSYHLRGGEEELGVEYYSTSLINNLTFGSNVRNRVNFANRGARRNGGERRNRRNLNIPN